MFNIVSKPQLHICKDAKFLDLAVLLYVSVFCFQFQSLKWLIMQAVKTVKCIGGYGVKMTNELAS